MIAFNVDVVPNTRPTASGSTHTLAVESNKTISFADLGYLDTDGDIFQQMTITSLPTKGKLTRYGYYPIAIGEHVSAESLAYGELVYEPDIDAVGSYVTAFSFTVNDGTDNSVTASIELNVTVTPNNAPVITGSSHSLAVAAAKTLSFVDLGYSDADGDALSSVNITVLPERGSLELYGSPVSTGVAIDASTISYGYLIYRPDSEAIASHVATLSFTANDGAMNSAQSAIIFNVTVSTNTPPVVTGSLVTVTTTSPVVLSLPQLGYSDADEDAIHTITLTELPETGTLLYYGYPVSVGSVVSAGNIASGYLTYAPDAENQSAHTASLSSRPVMASRPETLPPLRSTSQATQIQRPRLRILPFQ
jgi:hypothetical protein